MTYYGTDISSWQGHVINWNAVHLNGIRFAYVKLTEGLNYENPDDTSQIAGARSVGIYPGGFHYANPNFTALAQADNFADRLSAHGLKTSDSLMPAVDVEQYIAPAWDTWIAEFIRRMNDHGYPRVMVYASKSWFTDGTLNPQRWPTAHKLWVADWNGDPGNTIPGATLHQHTNRGNIDGFNGYVDRDCTTPGITLADILNYNPTPPPRKDATMGDPVPMTVDLPNRVAWGGFTAGAASALAGPVWASVRPLYAGMHNVVFSFLNDAGDVLQEFVDYIPQNNRVKYDAPDGYTGVTVEWGSTDTYVSKPFQLMAYTESGPK